MKVTVMHALPCDMERVPGLISLYREAGYNDGTRERRTSCILFCPNDRAAAAVWGGPEHIRISFGRSA